MPLVLSTAARAQETKPAAPQDAPRSSDRDWDPIPFAPDQNEVTITDLNLVPRQLLGALRRGECDYEEHIKQFPLRFVRAGNRRFAILFCQYGTAGSHRVYDFRHEWPRVPTLVQFPFLAHGRGFGATASPGFVTWDAQAATLTAILGSDLCPSPVLRHTYALGMLARCRGHRLSCSSVLKLTSTAAVLTELGPGKSFGKPRIGQLRYSRASAAKATAYSSPAKSLDIKTGRSYLPDSFSTHPLGVLTAWTGGGRDRLSAREEAHEIPSAA